MKPSVKHFIALGISAGVLFATSCETKSAKKTTPVQQALAPTIEQKPVPTPTPVPVAPQVKPEPPKQDPVVATIELAEQAYQAGQADYKAGHLDAAKNDFNHAVDILMQSPVDIKSDDRLQQEFDKITEGIHSLEMVAFKEGDGFTAQQSEPAPIDEANHMTFAPDPKVTAKAEAELKTTQSDLPLVINDYVAGYIDYYSTRGRGTFERAVVRSGRYRQMIERIFREEGVPQDLIYLAQAESGFHPLALSRAGARGMWQFMATRASGYGLQRNWWIDDRQDPEKATRAAARHLKDLYNEFGDWYLAMAAYNSGPGNVQQAVKRTGYVDFWELYRRDVLPKETKNYVPIILAMTIMSKNPAQYGLDNIQPDPPETYDLVTVDYPVDLRLVAECIDVPVERLADLNPGLLRRTTPKDQRFDLRLPEGAKERYEQAIAAIPKDKRVMWRYYRVQSGETLAMIAKKYRTTENAIAAANDLGKNRELTPDSKLVIPVSGSAETGAVAYSKHPTRYKVRKGDTVLSVADDFGVTPDRLRRWNRLKGNQLAHLRTLVIYKPLAPGERDVATVKHRRKKGKAHPKTASKQSSRPASSATLASGNH
ncbi:MAG TPA: transglycosylase SLT domain-containing protein [Candidatus Angelobacter sp.]|jgi:membrane-bound lytic murein transglycosylase D|nr:transglycosylase SLT domain-containing protein [Candidatus Angelobacter sp.]